MTKGYSSMGTDTLAVIIPNYNNSKYLPQCIESIIRQTYQPQQIVVVDDCSTDNSREVISELQQKYPVICPVFLEKNGGVSNARNVGLDRAQTEYVTYMDADDFYWNEQKLQLEMDVVRNFAAKGKDVLAYSVTAIVDVNGTLVPGNFNRRWNQFQFIKGNAKVAMISMTKQARVPRDYCIKKSILEGVGKYSFYKNFYEDLDLLMRIAQSGVEFHCTYQYGTAYRKGESGLSRRPWEEHLSTQKEIQSNYYTRLNPLEKLYCKFLQITFSCWMTLKLKVLVPIKNRLIK